MKKTYRIGEQAFSIIEASEGIEGFTFNNKTIRNENNKNIKFDGKITKDLVFEFLDCPDTKVIAVKNEDKYILLAHNESSNETIQIDGLGDHFFALAKAVHRAKNYLKSDQNHPKKLTRQFIESINAQLLSKRFQYEEIGIGKYRDLDYLGRPVNVSISSMKNGKLVLETPYYTTEGGDGRVQKEMNELVNWVNSEEFNDPEKIYENIAKFHAEFIRIHPFMDGNGRTARILTNYLLLINELPMTNIPANKRNEYIAYINYAEAISEPAFRRKNDEYNLLYSLLEQKYGKRDDKTRFLPLADFLKKNTIQTSVPLIEEIINYKGDKSKPLSPTQVHLDQNFDLKEQ